jgi:hemoglobin-like flavoprotein
MGLNVELLRQSFETVIERSPYLTHRFYEILYDRYPVTLKMFPLSRRAQQENMLTQALVAVLDHLEDAPWLTTNLRGLGARHVNYGVTDEMYSWVGTSLLATLREVAGDDWSLELENAWTEAFWAIANLMREGARLAVEAHGAPTLGRAVAAAS